MSDALSNSVAIGRMSIVSIVAPICSARAIAFDRVWSLVANPGIVYARMSLRGRPIRSMARATTSSACVESSPPLTPITGRGDPIARSRCSSPDTWMLNAS